jgi:hypothetical protein
MKSALAYLLPCLLIPLLLGLPALAFPQAALDTPSLSVVWAGQGKMRLNVVAGPSGAPAGFTVSWMRAEDLAARGGTWPEGTSDDCIRLSFTGVATLNTWGETERSFQLQPNEALDTEIGDLTDETGVLGLKVGELGGGIEYVFQVSANATAEAAASAPTGTLAGTTLIQGHDCTYTQGWWKNHQAEWPVESLTLGTVTYTKAQLLQILVGWAVRGNGLISLAHQLIAAKLNIADGANPAEVATAVAEADALIGALVVPPVGTASLAPSMTSALTQALDDYSNGLSGPGHCDTVPATSTSWGRLKSLYR